MPLNVGDYLADTMRLTTLQHGAYLLLLFDYWRSGPLPDSDEQLAAVTKVDIKEWRAKIGPVVRRFFSIGEDGLLHQKRADAEIERAGRISDARREAALKSHGKTANGEQEDSKPDANAPANAPANAEQSPVQNSGITRGHAVAGPLPRTKKDSGSLRSPGAATGTRLPDGWVLPETERQFARELGLDPNAVLAEFHDYWRGVPGAKGRKLDWPATFRNRCRDIAESRRPGSGRPRAKTAAAQWAELLTLPEPDFDLEGSAE